MNPAGYRIAVDAPLKETLTYLPPNDGAELRRGQSVQVPLGQRTVNGVVIEDESQLPSGDIVFRPIVQVDLERPLLSETFLDWTEWLSEYYLHPLGNILESVFPPLSRFKKKKARKVQEPKLTSAAPSLPPHLTEEQQGVLTGIRAHEGFNVHLLYGVTGSGKTEVYLQLIEEVLKKGQQALVLVPEISLTPQLIDRFSGRFPDRVAVIHSHLTPREKTDHWWSIVTKEKSILIGARSALFCPMPAPGLIIVDEEHEPSYKQEEQLKYHCRDAAVMLAKFTNIPIILGSATPSFESWKNAQEGKYLLHQMKHRVADRKLPIIEVVDLRDEREARKDTISAEPFWMSQRLAEELRATLEKREQAALFLNRRGMAPMAQCSGCGHVEECPNCAVSLTVHGRDHLVCHFCGYSQVKAKICPKCNESELQAFGMGTELLETDLKRMFPEARIARADRDEIQSRADLEEMIRSMESREIDILIGTQMIAKGLDFPHLTLVGLVMADIGFHWPDFRASERSFQLLTQVSGRSGRHSQEPGRVIVQTYNPLHPSILHTVQNSFPEFAESELAIRKIAHYPPFERIALLRIQSSDLERTKLTAGTLARRAADLGRSQPLFENVRVLGPAPAPLAKLRGRFRFQVLIKAPDAKVLHHFCKWLLANVDWIPAGTKVQVDVDPLHML